MSKKLKNTRADAVTRLTKSLAALEETPTQQELAQKKRAEKERAEKRKNRKIVRRRTTKIHRKGKESKKCIPPKG